MKKRVFSFTLALALIFTMVVGFIPIQTHAVTTSQQNIVNRANYLYNTTWVCKQTVKGWGATFYAGNTYRLPYGQPAYAGKYIGFGVSVDDFLAAAATPGSIFYTGRSHCGATTAPYYATDCSAYVSYCWGVNRQTTRTIPSISTYLGMANTTNVQKLQLGDALNSSSVGHVVLVTGLKYSGGQISQIEITEQTPPQLKRTYHTPSSLASKYGSYYGIYRYTGTVPTSPVVTDTAPQETPEQAAIRALTFDVDFYRLRYKDMTDAFGTNAGALKNHFDDYGLKEGRMGSVFFDAKYYLSKNADIANAFGSTNYAAALDHFVEHGFMEGRAGSEFFSAKVYLEKNADVAKAFGATNYLAAAQHYMDYGIKEMHRTASNEFSMQGYHDRHADLAKAFGSDGLQLIIHYITKGKAEGRDATPYYELPKITNVTVTDVTNDGFTLSCTVTSPHGVDYVSFPTWTKRNGQDDIVWHRAQQDGSTFSLRITASQHNYEGGNYITHIYAYDKNGKVNKYATGADLNAGMTIYDVAISDVDLTGYTVSCKVIGGAGVDYVKFPTWTEANGQDDLVWHEATRSGNSFTCRIDVKNHNKEGGKYTTHIYAYDYDGNVTSKSTGATDVGFILPTVSNVKITDVTNDGFTISCTATSPYGIDHVSFSTWTDRYGKDDILAHPAQQDGNTFSLRIPVSDHNYEGGTYHTTVQAYDTKGQNTEVPVTVDLVDAMTIYDITISDVDLTGYTVSCKVLGGAGVNSVKFPTWTDHNGQDDIVWHEATRSGNTFTYRVDIKEHNNETGKYNTDIYVYDKDGNIASKRTGGANLDNLITISDVTITDLDQTGYTICCKVTSQYGIKAVQFPTWTDYNGKDDLIWHEADGNGDVFSYRENAADHNYEGGRYITHIYAVDDTGSRYLTAAEALLSEDLTIYNVKITDQDATGYTVSCDVIGGKGVDHVLFSTWTNYHGQDDIHWDAGIRSGNNFTFHVDIKDHNMEAGRYYTRIFAYDQAWNSCFASVETDVEAGDNYLEGLPYADLGTDFHAEINIPNTALSLSGSNTQVITHVPSGTTAQLWYFVRQVDGSYKISNVKNGLYMTAQDNKVTLSTEDAGLDQCWFVYSVDGGYHLSTASAAQSVLEQKGSVGTDLDLKLYSGSEKQIFTVVKITDAQNVLLNGIRETLYLLNTNVHPLETVDYTRFEEAGPSSTSITIGAGCWSGSDAKLLLNRIRTADPELFATLDTAGVANDLDRANWNRYKLSRRSEKANCIKTIIGSETGRACQDALMDEQLRLYMNEAKALGVNESDAQILCAIIRQQAGHDTLLRILRRTTGTYTLEHIYKALQSDTSIRSSIDLNSQRVIYNKLKTLAR